MMINEYIWNDNTGAWEEVIRVMASEVKVDTISEKTTGSGVTIDGVLIKDGSVAGTVSLGLVIALG